MQKMPKALFSEGGIKDLPAENADAECYQAGNSICTSAMTTRHPQLQFGASLSSKCLKRYISRDNGNGNN